MLTILNYLSLSLIFIGLVAIVGGVLELHKTNKSSVDNPFPTRKNPWAAAILNFFFPGIGFVYLSIARYILGDITLFIIDIIFTVLTMGMWLSFDPIIVTIGISLSVLWAMWQRKRLIEGWLHMKPLHRL